MNDLKSLEVIERWSIFGRKKNHAQFIAKQYRSLGEEFGRMLDEIERNKPPVDSRDVFLVGDHIRVVKEMQRTIDSQAARIQDLLKHANRKIAGAK